LIMNPALMRQALHRVGQSGNAEMEKEEEEKRNKQKNIFLDKIEPVFEKLRKSFGSVAEDTEALGYYNASAFKYESTNTSEKTELWFFGEDKEKKVRIDCILSLSVQKSQPSSNDENIEVSGFRVKFNSKIDEKINLLFDQSNGYTGTIKDFAVEKNVLIVWKKMIFIVTLAYLSGIDTITEVTRCPDTTYDITIKFNDEKKNTYTQENYTTINANFTDDGPTPLVKVTHVDSWDLKTPSYMGWFSNTSPDLPKSVPTNPGNACEMNTAKELKEFIMENMKRKPIRSILMDLNNQLDIYLG
jgi:hypothetical protein